MKKIHLSILFFVTTFFVNAAFAVNFPSMESGKYGELCEEKWTKLGKVDTQMAGYCIQKEKEGYYKALEIIKKYDSQKWLQDLVNLQVQKWTKKGRREDSMVSYGLNKEMDGFEEISIASKSPGFNNAKMQACSAKWGIEFSMVWFCYKQ